MFKKKVSCCILAASLVTSAFAGNFYMGPSVLVQNISGSGSTYRDVHPKLSLGYGGFIDNYYLAGELNATPATVVLSNQVDNGSISAKTTQTFAASIIPGVIFNEKLMGFLRFGIASSRFSTPNVPKPGIMLGAGLQTGLNDNWDLRGEYVYTAYKSVSVLGSAKSNEIGIGAIYRFDT